MEQTFILRATPLAKALYLIHNPQREYERKTPYAASVIIALAAELKGTDSAVIKAGYTLLPHLEAKYWPVLARIIGSRRPLRYFQTLLRRFGEDALIMLGVDEKPAEPFMSFCGAVDASVRREAYKKRYPQKRRRSKAQADSRAA